jgi:hypothetical protein
VGSRVLFLCYNLPLEIRLKEHVARLKLPADSVEVMSFETLGHWLCAKMKIRLTAPGSGASRPGFDAFFHDVLPKAMKQAVDTDGFVPPFDALVVDEAQDHDTDFAFDDGQKTPGWWAIYLRLLKQGFDSRIAIFHDSAQRTPWRPGIFNIDDLADALMSPVRVQLSEPVRYTGELLRYLRTLSSAATEQLISGIGGNRPALIGPEVEEYTAKSGADEKNILLRIVADWRTGACACRQRFSSCIPTERSRRHGRTPRT